MAFERFKKAWSAFNGRDHPYEYDHPYSYGSSYQPDRPYYSFSSRKSLVTAIYNRIAVDVSMNEIKHVRLRPDTEFSDRQYETTINDDLNYALTCSPNIDQTSRDLIKQATLIMFDKGCVALVPTYTDVDPEKTESYTVQEIRVGEIVEWYPYSIKLDLYRDTTGKHEQIVLDKRIVPIIYNPFYEIMNESNSTLQRLMRVINQLETANNQTTSGKLDLIIQLPYSIHTDAQDRRANKRKKSIEKQLNNSKYGIAYIDATEKVIQLNRPLENNFLDQIQDLETKLYNQLGLTQKILDGTANENERLNYRNNTIVPILSAITESIEKTWLSKTARAQRQAIMYFNDPFKLAPATDIIKMADTLTRNEIASSNEIRSMLGLKPSKDKKADELINANINQSKPEAGGFNAYDTDENIQNE